MDNLINNICCVCGGRIISEEDLTICENCESLYHKLCWQDISEECITCRDKNKLEEK